MSLDRFKGVTATLEQWNNYNKIIPSEVWAIVVTKQTLGIPTEVGMKIGIGKIFSETPWIINPATLTGKIDKPTTETPSATKFLAEDLNFYEIDTAPGIDMNGILDYFDAYDLNFVSGTELTGLQELLYKQPTINSFSTSSSVTVEMGQSIPSSIPLSWNISNVSNVASASLSTSEGNWNGLGSINVASISGKTLTLVTQIISRAIKSVVLTLQLTTTKGSTISKTVSFNWTHRIYYGTSSVQDVSSYADLTNSSSVLSNSRFTECSFTPVGNQYSLIFIPTEVAQTGINIVNKVNQNVPHSYGMWNNISGQVTDKMYTRTINSISYNVYVSMNPSYGSSTAVIK